MGSNTPPFQTNAAALLLSGRREANGRRTVELTWTEQQGPSVEQPRRKGFGSQILERVLTQDLKAEVLLNYNPSGLCAKIKIEGAVP
jgi:two-component sensor histidine kinase